MCVYIKRCSIHVSLHGTDRAYTSEDEHKPKLFSAEVSILHSSSQEVSPVMSKSSEIGDSRVYEYIEGSKRLVPQLGRI